MSISLSISPGTLGDAWVRRLRHMESSHFAPRLMARDGTLWSNDHSVQEFIAHMMGWVVSPSSMRPQIKELQEFVEDANLEWARSAVLCGMGGSSLGPMVLAETFASSQGIDFRVLDSTDPATVSRLLDASPPEETLYLIASKSGTTAEPNAFLAAAYGLVRGKVGDVAGRHFVAITDPGTKMVEIARELQFRHTFLNDPEIGGRYSVLSYFGLVPAALIGVDLDAFVASAIEAENAHHDPGADGYALGALIGEAALAGADKLSLFTAPPFRTLGLWLEQIVAESTGKQGTGIVPVPEEFAPLERFGPDRQFVFTTLRDDDRFDAFRGQMEAIGRPTVAIRLETPEDLGSAFYTWMVATATAGAILGINPFDQPNVQEAKDATVRVLQMVKEHGELPSMMPTEVNGDVRLDGPSLDEFLARIRPGHYLAILAFLDSDDAADLVLESLRTALWEKTGVATTRGFGPRYLHSTGQLHKGGPDTGHFLLVTGGNIDRPIPGEGYGFRTFERAQALGDLEALRAHGRNVLHVDLGGEPHLGIVHLRGMIAKSSVRPH